MLAVEGQRLVRLTVQTARTACRSSSYIIEQMSSDSEVEDILLRTPTLQKLRTLERLSTDALDPDALQAVNSGSPQMRQSRPRDRQQRRSFSPLLDSTERDHYSVSLHSFALYVMICSWSDCTVDRHALISTRLKLSLPFSTVASLEREDRPGWHHLGVRPQWKCKYFLRLNLIWTNDHVERRRGRRWEWWWWLKCTFDDDE